MSNYPLCISHYAVYKPRRIGTFRVGRLNHEKTKRKIVERAKQLLETALIIRQERIGANEAGAKRAVPSIEMNIRFNKEIHSITAKKEPWGSTIVIDHIFLNADQAATYFDIPTWLRILKLLDKTSTRIQMWGAADDLELKHAKGKIQFRNPRVSSLPDLIEEGLKHIPKTEEAKQIIEEAMGDPTLWLTSPEKIEQSRKRVIKTIAKIMV